MQISEVRVKLVSNKDDRLKAFCSVTMDNEFVIRDIKIIEGSNGIFVAMPSRKMSDHCEKCGSKNHLRAKYCNNCGTKLPEERMKKDAKGRLKLHADIAHPINSGCRRKIQQKVAEAYKQEVENSTRPDYKPQDLDTPDDDNVEDNEDDGMDDEEVPQII